MNTAYPLKKRRHNALVLALGILASCALPASAGQIEPGAPLPSMQNKGLEGALPELKGKVVLVDFWASWCGPCKKAMPELNTFHREYGGKGLVVLGVNMDDKAADKDRFVAANPVEFPLVRDARHEYVKTIEPKSMPTTLLVDKKGVVRFVHNGFKGEKTSAALKTQIEQLLAEESK